MRLSISITLILCAVLAGLGTLPTADAQCTWGVIPRKEFRTMSYAEQYYYFQAVRALQKRANSRTLSIYDTMAKIHSDSNKMIHGVAVFFPWHRMFLWYYEKYLESVFNYPIRIPYWNWEYDSQAPEQAPVFTPNAFGNKVNSRGCVTNGWFSDWMPLFPRSHCLARTKETVMPSFHSNEDINRNIAKAQTYDDLRKSIEGAPHGRVHNSIGGDMLQMHSPNDPIFYSHHANVDKMWDVWQRLKPASNFWSYNGVTQTGGAATLNDGFANLPPAYKVGHVMDVTKLCYYYADMTLVNSVANPPSLVRRGLAEDNHFVNLARRADKPTDVGGTQFTKISDRLDAKPIKDDHPISLNSTDRDNLNLLRITENLPKEWLLKNGQVEAGIRIQEDLSASLVDSLNSLTGYVPKCALLNRPDMLGKLIKRNSKFTLTTSGAVIGFEVKSDDKKDSNDVAKMLEAITGSVPTTEVEKPISELSDAVKAVTGPPTGSKKSACNPLTDKKGKGLGKPAVAK